MRTLLILLLADIAQKLPGDTIFTSDNFPGGVFLVVMGLLTLVQDINEIVKK